MFERIDRLSPGKIFTMPVREGITRATRDPLYIQPGRSRLDVRKYFFSQRVVTQWNWIDSNIKERPMGRFKQAVRNHYEPGGEPGWPGGDWCLWWRTTWEPRWVHIGHPHREGGILYRHPYLEATCPGPLGHRVRPVVAAVQPHGIRGLAAPHRVPIFSVLLRADSQSNLIIG